MDTIRHEDKIKFWKAKTQVANKEKRQKLLYATLSAGKDAVCQYFSHYPMGKINAAFTG